jgi:hypothetical protein
MPETVPAAEFVRNFGRYKLQAQREAVPVSSNGTLAGYFVSPHEYERLRRGIRRSFDIVELTDEEFSQLEAAARMDPRHDRLNKLLEPDPK